MNTFCHKQLRREMALGKRRPKKKGNTTTEATRDCTKARQISCRPNRLDNVPMDRKQETEPNAASHLARALGLKRQSEN